MNAKETARTILPDLAIPTELIAQLLEAAKVEDLVSVIVAAYKIGYQHGKDA